jgi:HEAT repeat protein
MSFWKKVQEAMKTPEQKFAEAQELVKSQDPEGQAALEALLRRSTSAVRCLAAAALAEASGSRAVPALAAARTDIDPLVRRAAGAALDKVDRFWRKLPAARPAVEREIKEVSDQLAPFIRQSDTLLESAVQRYDQEPVRKAVKNLIEKGEDLVDEMTKTFDPELAGPVLLSITELIRKAKVVAAEGAQRFAAADEARVEGLRNSLSDVNPVTRLAAATALGMTRDPRHIPLLAVARTDADARVREAAVEALDRINPDWRKLPEAHVARDYELQALSAELTPILTRAQSALDTAEKLMPLLKLVESKDPGASEALQQAIKDPDPVLRLRAAAAMGQLGDPGAVPALRAAASDADERVRKNAEESLDKLTPDWREKTVQASPGEAAGTAPPKPGDATRYLQKAKALDVDRPACFACGKPLAGGESMLGGEGVVTFGFSSRPKDEIKQDYRLFDGTVCKACLALFCTDCVGQPIDRCPQCKGKTEPAFFRQIVELRDLARARRA